MSIFMSRNLRWTLLALLLAGIICKSDVSPDAAREKRLEWWREARFGMFIHWGLYAVPAGEWNGNAVPGIGEWIMNRAKIPVADYEKLAAQFNPVKFNADEWVAVAKSAGMKYIVITAKHHDGFAMFRSAASKYNIYDATPFHRDPLKELSVACQRAGLKLCFYYSQTQDWHEPDADGNAWDFPDESKKNFANYLDEKVKPQVRELLTNYGPIGLIWFDTPRKITKEQSQELADLVHSIQPDCLVSGRIGHGVGDYDSAGDNQISVGKVKREWETPVTLNDTWGFKKDDHNWKSASVLIHQLAQTVGQGGNYLLNVGPTAEGVIPQESVDRLASVGRWMKVNGESIYGTKASPFPYNLPWGTITTKPGKMYLHVLDWPKAPFELYGLKSHVARASLLANPPTKLKLTQKHDTSTDFHSVTLGLPAQAPDPADSVIVLDVNGEADVITTLLQQPGGDVTLPAYLSDLHPSGSGSAPKLDSRGVFEQWTDAANWLDWKFQVSRPGKFTVEIITSEQKYGRGWEGGHRIVIRVADRELKGAISNDGHQENLSNPYWPYVVSKVGSVDIPKSGAYTLELKPETIENTKKLGLTLVSVRLLPS